MSTIERAEVLIASPGRNFVTLRITTSDGVTGLGDATLNGRELAVASYLRDHVVPLLIGRDPARIEDTWQYLYRGAYWRRGPVTMTAIAAVDTALWDIKGKVADLPVYQLLGGRSRDGVMVYSHASGADTAELLDDVARFLDLGYLAVRAQAAVPNVKGTYGVRKGAVYEPAATALPDEQPWNTPAYLDFAPTYLAAVRERFGFGFHLLHDVHHRLTPIEAARFGKSVEDLRLFWMEDPTPAENQEAFRLIRRHTTTPIAVGENLSSIWDVQHLITEQLIDYVRTTVVHAGGITHLRRIFDLAALYQVRTGSHGATDLSPVSMAAAVHVDISVPNFGIQEHMGHTPEVAEVFRSDVRFENGMLHPSDAPGLGVEYDDDAAARFPYDPRYLPVARLADGSMHDW
ncbi:D-galactonate dehydratase family protein [Actinosynnema pretiosum subsp. pretiosum]|uniref:Mandelate racemase/muconate lactonizing protein n=2 Tax=Actinosynnema TaxID=40566 RepID=C6WS62_ACTMD|nr:D-mannonate dehydratase ManD [Actinosynnema mirum]ACU38882.1 Mandelate racemase/muconate lactonizing protein [Actinosynnema mirum DSM 43827]AXX32473.1 Starvation sensing protein RspA [Actinosynnema pretiosum subsp. pretiosum]QUF03603.1 D-galactonate dehydratase family protein [Actinosynnema pretiosum subsp. pretiosum]